MEGTLGREIKIMLKKYRRNIYSREQIDYFSFSFLFSQLKSLDVTAVSMDEAIDTVLLVSPGHLHPEKIERELFGERINMNDTKLQHLNQQPASLPCLGILFSMRIILKCV